MRDGPEALPPVAAAVIGRESNFVVQGVDKITRGEFKNMLPEGHGDVVIVKTVFEETVPVRPWADRHACLCQSPCRRPRQSTRTIGTCSNSSSQISRTAWQLR